MINLIDTYNDKCDYALEESIKNRSRLGKTCLLSSLRESPISFETCRSIQFYRRQLLHKVDGNARAQLRICQPESVPLSGWRPFGLLSAFGHIWAISEYEIYKTSTNCFIAMTFSWHYIHLYRILLSLIAAIYTKCLPYWLAFSRSFLCTLNVLHSSIDGIYSAYCTRNQKLSSNSFVELHWINFCNVLWNGIRCKSLQALIGLSRCGSSQKWVLRDSPHTTARWLERPNNLSLVGGSFGAVLWVDITWIVANQMRCWPRTRLML